MSDDYTRLQTAVQDLLAELRISEDCLHIMSKGYSPDYPGAFAQTKPKSGAFSGHSDCKVQLSTVVAQKLIDAGVV